MTADALVQKLDQVRQPILRRIKRGLPESHADHAELYFIEDQTAEEVGQRLGLSAAGVRQTARRAIQVLRESLRASAFLTQR